MAEVHTRDEAITAVDQVMQGWATDVIGLLAQAQNTASIASDGAEGIVRKCANDVAVIEALLAAAPDEQRAELRAQRVRARDAHERATRGTIRVREVEARIARLSRTATLAATSQVPEARAQLAGMSRALDGYRTGGIDLDGRAPHSGRSARGPRTAFEATGLVDLDVAAADLDDNPILDDSQARGTFGKGGLSRADYRWAVQTWNDVVGPGVAGGKTREDFVERDTQSNALPLRRTADVHDMFLGSDRIRVDRQQDGSLNIVNGRHRFEIARELGIKTLPGQVSD